MTSSQAMIAVAMLTSVAAHGSVQESSQKAVEVLLGGDDGLTQELTVHLRDAVAVDPDLVSAPADRIRITIVVPNVDWQERRNGTIIHARIEIKYLHVKNGMAATKIMRVSCKEDGIENCVKPILRKAKSILRQ